MSPPCALSRYHLPRRDSESERVHVPVDTMARIAHPLRFALRRATIPSPSPSPPPPRQSAESFCTTLHPHPLCSFGGAVTIAPLAPLDPGCHPPLISSTHCPLSHEAAEAQSISAEQVAVHCPAWQINGLQSTSEPSACVIVVLFEHVASPSVHNPLDEHVAPSEQSATVTQAVLHFPLSGSQVNGAQFLGKFPTHCPSPSHCRAEKAESPSHISPPVQVVPSAGKTHCVEAPLHSPPQVVFSPKQWVRLPLGCPPFTSEHCPTEPALAQY